MSTSFNCLRSQQNMMCESPELAQDGFLLPPFIQMLIHVSLTNMPGALGSSSWSGPALGTEHRGKWTQLLKEGCDPTLAMYSQAEYSRPRGLDGPAGAAEGTVLSQGKETPRWGGRRVHFFIVVMLLISPLHGLSQLPVTGVTLDRNQLSYPHSVEWSSRPWEQL